MKPRYRTAPSLLQVVNDRIEIPETYYILLFSLVASSSILGASKTGGLFYCRVAHHDKLNAYSDAERLEELTMSDQQLLYPVPSMPCGLREGCVIRLVVIVKKIR